MTISVAFLTGWLSLAGYAQPQRDAIVWNARRESGLQPATVGKHGHVGLFQWGGSRKAALLRFAAGEGRSWSDPDTQLKFMNREIRRMRFARRFFAATSATAARALFCQNFERSARC